MTARKKTASFESGLERLEQIAVQMEGSDIPLDDLMSLYEEGMKLAKELEGKLNEAAGRMKLLSADPEAQGEEALTDITEEMKV